MWNTENQPTSITGPDNVTETYLYNADGTRVARTRAGLTTVYAGSWEEDFQSGSSKETRAFLSLQGRTIAQRARTTAPATDTTIYLHGDHLGSVSVATSSTGAVLSKQGFTPWGEVRPNGYIAQTTLNYTGQKLDGTGLLFYNARYYDPKLGMFASADSVAPGKGDPQNRNRYSYVRNNPLKFLDPTGHCTTAPREGNEEDAAENQQCNMYITWLRGWGIEVDLATYNNWHSSQLGAVWQGALRMSDRLGWGTDGRLFREHVLGGGNLLVKKLTDDGTLSCGVSTYACSSASEMRFTGRAFLPENEDEWAFDQRLVIHELSHVWDFNNGKHLQKGLDSVLRLALDKQRDKGGTPKPFADYGASVEEDFAESVAFYVMTDSPAQGQPGFVNSHRWGYVQCIATASPQHYDLCHP